MPLQMKMAALGIAAYLAAACAVCQAQAASTTSEPAPSTSSGLALSSSKGQAWPNKPIRLLVGFPPGGPTDVVARIVGDKVAKDAGLKAE